jgi:hypothetical protein
VTSGAGRGIDHVLGDEGEGVRPDIVGFGSAGC